MASMQRKRLKKVVDPMKYMFTLALLDYKTKISSEVTDNSRSITFQILRTKMMWLVASSIPLGCLTKSLMIPFLYVVGGY